MLNSTYIPVTSHMPNPSQRWPPYSEQRANGSIILWLVSAFSKWKSSVRSFREPWLMMDGTMKITKRQRVAPGWHLIWRIWYLTYVHCTRGWSMQNARRYQRARIRQSVYLPEKLLAVADSLENLLWIEPRRRVRLLQVLAPAYNVPQSPTSFLRNNDKDTFHCEATSKSILVRWWS